MKYLHHRYFAIFVHSGTIFDIRVPITIVNIAWVSILVFPGSRNFFVVHFSLGSSTKIVFRRELIFLKSKIKNWFFFLFNNLTGQLFDINWKWNQSSSISLNLLWRLAYRNTGLNFKSYQLIGSLTQVNEFALILYH